MSDYLRLLVAFLAAVNPPAVAASLPEGWRARPSVLVVAAATIATLGGIALVAEPFLDWLEVEPETFRVAAGIVMALGGGIAVIFGRWRTASSAEMDEGWVAGIFPLAIPLVLGPWVIAALISYSVDHGEGIAIGVVLPAAAAGLALAATAWRPKAVVDGSARILGLLLLAIAAGLIVDGIRAI